MKSDTVIRMPDLRSTQFLVTHVAAADEGEAICCVTTTVSHRCTFFLVHLISTQRQHSVWRSTSGWDLVEYQDHVVCRTQFIPDLNTRWPFHPACAFCGIKALATCLSSWDRCTLCLNYSPSGSSSCTTNTRFEYALLHTASSKRSWCRL